MVKNDIISGVLVCLCIVGVFVFLAVGFYDTQVNTEAKVRAEIEAQNIKYMEETGKCPYEFRDTKKVVNMVKP